MSRERTAYHEAGHTVIGRVLRLDCGEATMKTRLQLFAPSKNSLKRHRWPPSLRIIRTAKVETAIRL